VVIVSSDQKRVLSKSFTSHKTRAPLAGFFFNDGPFWAEQRRFSLRHLRDFGFGKRSLEGIIMDEAEELIKRLQYKDVQVSTSVGKFLAEKIVSVSGNNCMLSILYSDVVNCYDCSPRGDSRWMNVGMGH
jgi:hypothetical protein